MMACSEVVFRFHYIRPFGGRKILYIWETIERDMGGTSSNPLAIPMANGGVMHG